MTAGPKKVAVLGGGLGSMVALAGIVSAKEWDNQYDFTLYERSWRLGGKGASGREPVNPDGSWGDGSRILEHGLHIWFGFYNNGFHYMQTAFDALGEDWSNFYTPLDLAVFQDEVKHGKQQTTYSPWPINFPTNSGVPGTPELFGWGTPSKDDSVPTGHRLVGALLPFIREMLQERGALEQFDKLLEQAVAESHGFKKLALEGVEELADGLGGITSWLERLEQKIEKALAVDVGDAIIDEVIKFINVLQTALQGIELLFDLNKDLSLRHIFIIVDLGTSMMKGVLQDQVLSKGFESINNIDFTAWLKKAGATKWTLNSSLLTALYDLVFGYEKGDINQRNFSAGVCLYAVTRIFLTYKGHILWKMNMGMGDTIFTTLEKYLASKGVKFKYFHEVKDICMSEDGSEVTSVKMLKTIKLKDEAAGYDPYVILPYAKSTSGEWPCWPEQPLWDQIDPDQAKYYQEQQKLNGTSIESPWLKLPDSVEEVTLEQGTDFEQVISGITLRALVPVTKGLYEKNTKWKNMLDNVQTVTTMAYQLWFKKTAQETGFNPGDPKYDEVEALVGGYARPWGTQADLSHLLPAEDWGTPDPKYLIYSCCPMPMPEVPVPLTEHDYPKKQTDKVEKEGWEWLEQRAGGLWPNCAPADNPDGLAKDQLDSEYWRAGTSFTEHYVLSVANSNQYRLLSDDLGVKNFFIAGDWTRNVINAGCVEAGTISGLFCARQFTKWDIPIYNVDPEKGGWTGT